MHGIKICFTFEPKLQHKVVTKTEKTDNMKYQKEDGGRKQAFPNADKRAGDCVIRSIAIATQQDYKKVWNDLFSIALETGNFPNADSTCVKYLEQQGWERIKFGKKLVRLNSKFIPKNKTF